MEEIDLPVLNNSSSDNTDDNIRKKRAINNWELSGTFESKEDALKIITDEKIWRIEKSNVFTNAGIQSFYYCHAVSQRSVEKCPAKIYLLFSATANKYCLYRNNKEHVHESEGQIPAALRNTARLDILDKVKEYLQLGCSPRAISNKIRNDEGIEIKPTHGQVRTLNYLLTFVVILFNIIKIEELITNIKTHFTDTLHYFVGQS